MVTGSRQPNSQTNCRQVFSFHSNAVAWATGMDPMRRGCRCRADVCQCRRSCRCPAQSTAELQKSAHRAARDWRSSKPFAQEVAPIQTRAHIPMCFSCSACHGPASAKDSLPYPTRLGPNAIAPTWDSDWSRQSKSLMDASRIFDGCEMPRVNKVSPESQSGQLTCGADFFRSWKHSQLGAAATTAFRGCSMRGQPISALCCATGCRASCLPPPAAWGFKYQPGKGKCWCRRRQPECVFGSVEPISSLSLGNVSTTCKRLVTEARLSAFSRLSSRSYIQSEGGSWNLTPQIHASRARPKALT
ncbi:unnamed protein product [Polarella glacialis]|uniref:Uncharacterized protein n=1 Tax=Polarella glacialis TaxID=89957 RepID=A0A813FFW5_POLGL|nr:unnamed protein product [Polarella glacialis]